MTSLFILIALLLSPSGKLEKVAWMTGCWERTLDDDVRTEENWSTPREGVMYGSGRTTRAGKAVEYEITRIFERNDSLVYASKPSGQPAAQFTTHEALDKSVTFSNPGHDFPQRIIYAKGTADSMFARIEGQINGQQRGMDFHMKRVSCGNAATIQKTIRGLDSLWARTYQVHDTASAWVLMADDILITSSNGTTKNRDIEMRDIRPAPGLKMDYFRTRDVTVQADEFMADVSGVAEWRYHWNGRDNEVKRLYSAKYLRGGPLGWRIVDIKLTTVPQ